MSASKSKFRLAVLIGAACLVSGCASTSGPKVQFPPDPNFPPDHEYTLDDLVQLSIHRNASLDVTRWEAESAQGLVDQIKALWLPVLRYDFAATAYDNDLSYRVRAFHLVSINVPLTGSYNLVNSLTASQIVTTFGKRTSGLKQAKMYAAIKKLEVLRQQDAVAQDVATYYQLVCLTNDIDGLLDDTLRRIRVFRQVSGHLNKLGSLRGADLDTLEAEFFASQLEQIQLAIQAGRHQAYTALRQAVGVEHDEPLPLKSLTLPAPVSAEELFSAYAKVVQGFMGRPEMKQVDLFAKLRAEQTTFAKLAHLPNVAFILSEVNTTGSPYSILSAVDGLIAGVIVDWAIYDPARRGRLREAMGLEQAAAAFRREVEELISLEIEVTAVDCQRALVGVFQAERGRRVAAEHCEAARQAYSRELVPASAVVTAIAVNMLAEIEYRQAVFTYQNARAKLIRVTAEREALYGY